MCSINNIALFQRKIKSFLAVNSKWHCGGCLIKRARGYAARSSTRHKRKQPNKKVKNERRTKGAFALNRLQIAPLLRAAA